MDRDPDKNLPDVPKTGSEDTDSRGDDGRIDLRPEDQFDPVTAERDRHPRTQKIGCGLVGLLCAATAAGLVAGRMKQHGLGWFVALVLLLAPMVSYFFYWVFFSHSERIAEKIKAERAARGVREDD